MIACVAYLALVLASLGTIFASVPVEEASHNAIWLNSTHLALTADAASIAVPREWLDQSPLAPRGSSVLDALQAAGMTPGIMLADPRHVAAAVLASLPPTVCVIPTEGYFYFEMIFHGELIAGNLRLTDADKGILHCGYYLRRDQNVGGYAALSAADGVCVSSTTVNGHPLARVTDERTGVDVDFLVVDPASLKFCDGVPLLPGERLISPIIDESGTCLALLFSDVSSEFYYVLRAAVPGDEPLPVDASACALSPRSGFLYMRDGHDRQVLVGVREDEIVRNSFFDGPFDQVPPRLPLCDLLLKAYPGIEKYNGDTLDEHGNWVASRSTRVAISPYITYPSGGLDGAIESAARRIRMRAGLNGFADAAQAHNGAPTFNTSSWTSRIREHAREWPQGHDLYRSAESLEVVPSP